jgi:hypothetical protein
MKRANVTTASKMVVVKKEEGMEGGRMKRAVVVTVKKEECEEGKGEGKKRRVETCRAASFKREGEMERRNGCVTRTRSLK